MIELARVPTGAVYSGLFWWQESQLLFKSDGTVLIAELIPQEPANDE